MTRGIIDTIEERLRAAIREAVADGWCLYTGRMLDADTKTCCALGAVVRDSADRVLSDNMAFDEAVHRLGIRDDEAVAIARGFDGIGAAGHSEALYALGARLRADYLGEGRS